MKTGLCWPPDWIARLRGADLLPSLLARRPRSSQLWLQSLESLVFVDPRTRALPAKDGEWEFFKAGLLYAVDDLDRAHAVFQQVDSAEGAYWHGMLHRREGDFPNARYWARRAGSVGALAALEGFSPVDFIGRCEAAAKTRTDPQNLLNLQMREWEAMIHWSWLRLCADNSAAVGDE